MPWFPVVEEEVAAAEAALGTALPSQYKALLLDPRVRQILAHPSVGALSADATMHDFVAFTARCRATLPGFPADGVAATNTPGRFVRFWRPDPQRAGVLGEMLYAWDTERQRASKDCTSEASVRTMIAVVHGAAPDFLASVGYPAPPARKSPPLFRARRGNASLSTVLAARGDAVEAMLASATDAWLPCDAFEVRGRFLVPCDLGELPEGSGHWALEVEPGRYRAEVHVTRSARSERVVIAAVRVVREERVAPDATKVATVDVDHAALAVYDRQTFLKRVGPEQRELFSMELLETTDLPVTLETARRAHFLALVIPTGDGDGTFPVYELRDGADVVGLEIRFVGGD